VQAVGIDPIRIQHITEKLKFFEMKIGFVFTNYNNSKFSWEAVSSIALNEFVSESKVIIVDNCSEDKEIDLLHKIALDYPNVHIIYNKENLGYFKGLNTGIQYLRKVHKDISHIVIGNNDLIFPDKFIKSIIENEVVFDKFPVISPDLITLDGKHQNPHVIHKISWFRELVYDFYYSSYLLAWLITLLTQKTKSITDRNDEAKFRVAQTIWQGYGACYILGPLFFKYFEELWAPTFLMGEEFFLSRQIENENMKVYYDPKFVVIHQEHASMSKIPRKTIWEFSRKSHRIYRKYVKVWH
jgi:hypothetical protein